MMEEIKLVTPLLNKFGKPYMVILDESEGETVIVKNGNCYTLDWREKNGRISSVPSSEKEWNQAVEQRDGKHNLKP